MEQWIYWFRELRSQDKEKVGKKCANLGELTALGLRVPPGFAVSVKGFEQFMNLTRAADEVRECLSRAKGALDRVDGRITVSCKARELIESQAMPPAMEEEILTHYHELCRLTGSENQAVAVRSSGAVSMPGQMETYLNVSGDAEVISHIKKVWGSAYTARAITFRRDKGLPIEWAPIGVAIMSLVDAKAAGVILTVAPTTGDISKIVIEGNWGFGESVVSGEITPDSFTIDKNTMEITERKIARKAGMIKTGPKGTIYCDTAENAKEEPCLKDCEVLELARVAAGVEEHFGEPQDMEWVIDKSEEPDRNIFWLQARPARYLKTDKGNERDYLIDLMVNIFK
ncbi:MAG TPA: PEP/pyruvate-binding domain-containing protein [Syntrophorhabdaceae bacterium]|jgi:pyruvate,water dikinase